MPHMTEDVGASVVVSAVGGVTGDTGTSATWTRTPRSGSRGTRPGRPPRTTAASRRSSSSRRLEEQMKVKVVKDNSSDYAQSILDKAATSGKRQLKELLA